MKLFGLLVVLSSVASLAFGFTDFVNAGSNAARNFVSGGNQMADRGLGSGRGRNSRFLPRNPLPTLPNLGLTQPTISTPQRSMEITGGMQQLARGIPGMNSALGAAGGALDVVKRAQNSAFNSLDLSLSFKSLLTSIANNQWVATIMNMINRALVMLR